jgi:hypothetical protein
MVPMVPTTMAALAVQPQGSSKAGSIYLTIVKVSRLGGEAPAESVAVTVSV